MNRLVNKGKGLEELAEYLCINIKIENYFYIKSGVYSEKRIVFLF